MVTSGPFSHVVEVRGHIIDSLILPRILDELMDHGVDFTIESLDVGKHKTDPSHARIEISASSQERLSRALTAVQVHGAMPIAIDDVELDACPADGVLPEDFYSTTNLDTLIRLEGSWVEVDYPEMDCVIRVADNRAECAPAYDLRAGDKVVVGHKGIRIVPLERSRSPSPLFGFMGSTISSEKPRSLAIEEAAIWIKEARTDNGKIAVVAGPAIVHTASRDYLCRLIRAGYVDVLLAGNALAAHDIEASLFGTSLGVPLAGGQPPDTGHEHHLRAINVIRAAGSISKAVESGALTEGIMFECVQNDVKFVLAGSIRDDGPLPEVITDVLEAQRAMRECARDKVRVALMLSTMLHSIAMGNLLPAHVHTVAVDINPAALTKLVDRGSFQSIGLVMDVGGFLRELLDELGASPE